jgi:hypothetical protein
MGQRIDAGDFFTVIRQTPSLVLVTCRPNIRRVEPGGRYRQPLRH